MTLFKQAEDHTQIPGPLPDGLIYHYEPYIYSKTDNLS